ncbi:unnamed protein product [Chironomus riparius]|uniref:SET domain-containing protein n=1 Tax=Chironomus riparius TaxID=315576 RepID=A0A9N9WUC4_9DIPT|nr:unnamed protein product [Chironomus riparius]
MCDDMFHVALNHKTRAKGNIALKLGNKYYNKQNYFLALILYNQLLSHAKRRKDLSIGYANRSAIYYEVEMYEECLQNIQLARDNRYPEDKFPQLNEREMQCRESMLEPKIDEGNPLKIFKLSYPPNKKVPWIVDRVEVRTTEKYGRGIYASCNLEPGDIICIEDILINFRDTNHEYSHCYNCYKTNALNLIPCDLTGHMMFCSTACRDDLYCKAINIDGIVSADVKILSDIAKAFGSKEKIDDFILNTDPEELNKTIFDFDFNNQEDPEYQKNLMTCLLSLSTNEHSNFGECCNIYNYVSEQTAQRILSVFNLNSKKSLIFVNENEYLEVGCHVSLFASLINHSCLNNAFTVLVDNKVATVIQHPVKAGEQIFFNYISDTITTKSLTTIEELHMFRCDCRLCTRQIRPTDMCLRNKITHELQEGRLAIIPKNIALTDYDQVKEYLKEKWIASKDVSIEQKYNSPATLYPLAMLDYVAGKSAYPFLY